MIKEFFVKLMRLDLERPKLSPFLQRAAEEKARLDKIKKDRIKAVQDQVLALQQNHKEQLRVQANQEKEPEQPNG